MCPPARPMRTGIGPTPFQFFRSLYSTTPAFKVSTFFPSDANNSTHCTKHFFTTVSSSSKRLLLTPPLNVSRSCQQQPLQAEIKKKENDSCDVMLCSSVNQPSKQIYVPSTT